MLVREQTLIKCTKLARLKLVFYNAGGGGIGVNNVDF